MPLGAEARRARRCTRPRGNIDFLWREISSFAIEGWPWPHDNPPDWNDVGHECVGLFYSPETVKGIVAAFETVSAEHLADELERAWSKMSKDPADCQLSEPHYFGDSAKFLEYLSGWLQAFKEAASQDHALGIGGG